MQAAFARERVLITHAPLWLGRFCMRGGGLFEMSLQPACTTSSLAGGCLAGCSITLAPLTEGVFPNVPHGWRGWTGQSRGQKLLCERGSPPPGTAGRTLELCSQRWEVMEVVFVLQMYVVTALLSFRECAGCLNVWYCGIQLNHLNSLRLYFLTN